MHCSPEIVGKTRKRKGIFKRTLTAMVSKKIGNHSQQPAMDTYGYGTVSNYYTILYNPSMQTTANEGKRVVFRFRNVCDHFTPVQE
jgi:hypothetical protein